MAGRVVITKEWLQAAVERYPTTSDIATVSGYHVSSLKRAAARFGISLKGGYGVDTHRRLTAAEQRGSARANLGAAQAEADRVRTLIEEDRRKRETHAHAQARSARGE